jgi:hypothetical protein
MSATTGTATNGAATTATARASTYPASTCSDALALSFADLEAFDSGATAGGRERRFCCPLCGDGKSKTPAHRCFGVNCESGAFHCHRCDARGKLTDFWEKRPDHNATNRAQRARMALNRALSLQAAPNLPTRQPKPKTKPEAPPNASAQRWREIYDGAGELANTAGAKYLQGRGIALEVAALSGVRFARNYPGTGAAVLFPIYDGAGELCAISARAIEGSATRAGGQKSSGVFGASWRAFEPITPKSAPSASTSTCTTCRGRAWTAFDRALPAVIVCEAPIDALSLATCGFPALALIGCNAPAMLHRATAFRRVLLATDADNAGDHAAQVLAATLPAYGATCERLRPDGAKDWNEMLQVLGRDEMSGWLASCVL